MEEDVDAGLLEAIRTLDADEVAALQAECAESAASLRAMMSCVESYVRTEDSKFALAA